MYIKSSSGFTSRYLCVQYVSNKIVRGFLEMVLNQTIIESARKWNQHITMGVAVKPKTCSEKADLPLCRTQGGDSIIYR